jgi:integrase
MGSGLEEDTLAPRIVGRLTSRRVNTAKPKAGRQALVIGDGGGLWLQVTRGEGDHLRRSWTFRFEIGGKRREMGLGALSTFSLAEVRVRAKALRQQLADGIDPLAKREADKQARLVEQASTVTFEQCAKMFLKLHERGWGAAHRHQWNASLSNYVYPKIGRLPVRDIDQAAIMQLIEPLWSVKTTTASRVRSRIEAILDYALAHKFRQGDNPARILAALPKPATIAKPESFASLPWQDVPQFMSELRALQSVAARCTEFLILTAARTGEAIGARWDEIDLKAKTWTVPADRMKAGIKHSIPLSDRAVKILSDLPRIGPLVFGHLHEAALRRAVLAKLRPDGRPQCSTTTIHGFRASFKTWCSEATNYAPEIAEAALAHARGNRVTRAYDRGDLLQKRARLMQAWADFLAKPAKATAGNVVTLKAGA